MLVLNNRAQNFLEAEVVRCLVTLTLRKSDNTIHADIYFLSYRLMSKLFALSLTLLHSEQPKLCGVLAVLSAIGLSSVNANLLTQKMMSFQHDFTHSVASRGTLVERLEQLGYGAESRRIARVRGSCGELKTLSVNPAVNGYLF